ncbi:hypothetical protein ACH5RR_008653 [Cinchona calisaya]|uniref:Peptidase A1 domain-containing protein n=1 Tax=Cinchona calisaya TaxID=153742 RepID=A0ABD3AEG6_9GENT
MLIFLLFLNRKQALREETPHFLSNPTFSFFTKTPFSSLTSPHFYNFPFNSKPNDNMVQMQRPFLPTFFILVLLFCFSSVSNSVRDHEKENYQFFDFSDSLQKTRQVFSAQTPQHEDPMPATTIKMYNSSVVLSFSLHPRTSVQNDYSTLTLTRLTHDLARVNYINSKVEFALSGYTYSDLELPLTSGASKRVSEYLVRIGVGRPVKSYYMVIDTNTDLNWLQCQPCVACNPQADLIFDPSSSSTYRPISCSSKECGDLPISACSGGTCHYQVRSGYGSYTVGDLATETVWFGSSGSVSGVPFVCTHDNVGLFIATAGLLSLAQAPLSLPSLIKATSFSYCFVDRDSNSSSTLEFNSSPPSDSIIASMVRNPNSKLNNFYYVDIVGIIVGGMKLPIPESIFQVDRDGRGGIILDSRTDVTWLRPRAYNSLRDAFVKYTSELPLAGRFYEFETCYNFSSVRGLVRVPTVSFLFASGKMLPLKPNNYLVRVDSKGTYCFAFALTPGTLSVIGNVQQQGMRVSFDLAKRQLGFSLDKC